jgi:hypothetical protein
MEHGRDHDERLHHAHRQRSNNIPPDEPATDLESDLLTSGRHQMAPHEGVIGAHESRPGHSVTGQSDSEGEEPLGRGVDVAPTEQALRREQERHRLERESGRIAAGSMEQTREVRGPEMTREKLDEIAREADRRTTGHEIGKSGLGASYKRRDE